MNSSVTTCCRIVAFSITLLATPARSQSSIALSDEATISLITMYPGPAAYELFAHSGLRVQDPVHGFDLLYNYGTFQFDGAFLPKFIYGKLDYLLWVSDFRRELQRYRIANRSVVEQLLALNHEQRQAVFDFLQYNALEENRSYRYDFLFDNCSTRIRDVFERTLGDSLKYNDGPDSGYTFRELLDPYVAPKPFLDLGIDLALGMPTDQQATHREAMFLPLYLMNTYDKATLIGENSAAPFVTQTDTLFWAEGEATTLSRAPLYLLMWLVFVTSLWVTNGVSTSAKKLRPWFDRLLFGFGGLTGLLAFFLWFIAIHAVTNYNWNLLWAWPSHLIAVYAFSARPRWLRPYMRIYTFAVFVTVLGWYFWPQELNSALLPVLLAFLVRGAGWGWKEEIFEEKAPAALTDPRV